ncbi:hypothetical protein HN51_035159, partial [Arachis hypogaea]
VLAVKKLEKRVCDHQEEEDFLELVNGIDRTRHVTIVKFIGYCSERGQRLLIYEYCSNGSLNEALHQRMNLKQDSHGMLASG